MASRPLLIGATGQIGRHMLQLFGSRALPTTRATPPPGWISLDLATITSAEDAERILAGFDLDAIYCIAGMTNVEACEDQESLAMQVNAKAPAALAAVATKRGLPFVYYSTEYIFDGTSGPYSEDDPANPISVYGRSKWLGELAVRDACPQALILRTTVVYGPDAEEKNFVYSLMRNLRSGQSMRVAQDQVSTPTYNLDLAIVTSELVRRHATGIFHICGPDLLSRLVFAQQVAEELSLDVSLIEGVPTSALRQRAPRPLDAGLRIDKLRREHPGLTMRTVQQSIADCRPALERFLANT
jgi:dTDP-4-dehydrorhamnose reductase